MFQNKPNGQFHLEFDADIIRGFMRDLPIRKIPGIGRVTERLLDSIGIKVNDNRILPALFRRAQATQGMRGCVRTSCCTSTYGQGVRYAVAIQCLPGDRVKCGGTLGTRREKEHRGREVCLDEVDPHSSIQISPQDFQSA